MSKVSFAQPSSQNPNESKPVIDVVAEVRAEGTPAPSTALAIRPTNTSVELFGGSDNIDFRDLQLPRINIVQKVGELSDKFNPGTILLNGSLQLPQPVEFIVLGFRPLQYVERVEGGFGGQICNSPEDVVAAGGTLDYKEHDKTEKPWFQTLATAVVLVKQPAGVNEPDLFSIELGDSRYALALWSMKGGSYTNAAKPIFTQRKIGSLRKAWHAHAWLFTTELEKYKTGNSAYIPVLKRGSLTPDNVVSAVTSLFS